MTYRMEETRDFTESTEFEMLHERTGLKSISATKLQTASLVTLTVILIGFALHWLRPVLVPLIIAVAVSYVFIPFLDFLTGQFRFPKALAVVITLAFGSGIFGFFLWLIVSAVRQLTTKSNMKIYEKSINLFFSKTTHFFEKLANQGGNSTLVDLGKEQISELPVGETILGYTNDLIRFLMELTELGFLVLIFTIYILQAYQTKQNTQPRTGTLGIIETRIKRYLLIKTLLSALMGASAGIILLMLGVKYIGLVMLMNFIFNYIPNVGPVVATIIPVPFMILADFSWFPVSMAIILPTTAHLLIGGILEPQLMGEHLDIHPITVMLGLIFWGMLWGLPGMFMSAPLTALCKICFEHIEFTAPVAKVLAGDIDFIRKF